MLLIIKKEYGSDAANTILHNKFQKGFSLIELLIALSIFLIISSAFFLLYTRSLSDIVYAGHKNKALYKAQQELEGLIQSNYSSSGTDEIKINFPGIENPVKIRGKLERSDVQYEERSVSIIFFVPNSGEN